MAIIKANPGDTGCWIDGREGIYMNALIILKAEDYGYDNQEITDIARKHADHQIYPSKPDITDEESITLDEEVDNVIEWMNDNIAPEGYAFGTYDGDFFFASDEWWQE